MKLALEQRTAALSAAPRGGWITAQEPVSPGLFARIQKSAKPALQAVERESEPTSSHQVFKDSRVPKIESSNVQEAEVSDRRFPILFLKEASSLDTMGAHA